MVRCALDALPSGDRRAAPLRAELAEHFFPVDWRQAEVTTVMDSRMAEVMAIESGQEVRGRPARMVSRASAEARGARRTVGRREGGEKRIATGARWRAAAVREREGWERRGEVRSLSYSSFAAEVYRS